MRTLQEYLKSGAIKHKPDFERDSSAMNIYPPPPPRNQIKALPDGSDQAPHATSLVKAEFMSKAICKPIENLRQNI